MITCQYSFFPMPYHYFIFIPKRSIGSYSQLHYMVIKSSLANSSRASGVAKQLISSPRAAHPCGAFCSIGNSGRISYKEEISRFPCDIKREIRFCKLPSFNHSLLYSSCSYFAIGIAAYLFIPVTTDYCSHTFTDVP